MIILDRDFGDEDTNTEVMQTPIILLGEWRCKSHDFGGKLFMLILDGFEESDTDAFLLWSASAKLKCGKGLDFQGGEP